MVTIYHEPREHAHHDSDYGCECWYPFLGEARVYFICPKCSAAYTKFMSQWKRFVCADCDTVYERDRDYPTSVQQMPS